MPKTKKTPPKKPLVANAKPRTISQWLVEKYTKLRQRVQTFLKRRPHRSFRRTYRRDYTRSLKLPGYWAFTLNVLGMLRQHKKLFLLLALIYAVITAAVVGVASQTNYSDYSSALRDSGSKLFSGSWWEVGQAGILLTTGILGSLNDAPSEVGQFVAVLLGLMTWLATVWLLRVIMAGKKPRLRDALYNAGAPIIPTAFVFLVAVVQLLPVALAFIAFAAASSTGLINDGVESMVFWVVETLLLTLSLYLLTSTLFALIVITLPGMYPMQALRTAGDLVIGRRVRILLRFMWLFGFTFAVWAVTIIPIILFDNWLKGVWPAIAWLPLVPICLLVVASLSIVWMSAYTYMLYRRVVDDDAAPA